MIKGATGAVLALAMGWLALAMPASAQTFVNIRSQDATIRTAIRRAAWGIPCS